MDGLDNLGIEEKKRLKCSAHPNLAVDSAIDSVLKDVEKTIGRDQMTSLNLGDFQSDSSVAMLGLIAIAKCLIPSHAALTYSLYTDYKDWREESRLKCKRFQGVSAQQVWKNITSCLRCIWSIGST